MKENQFVFERIEIKRGGLFVGARNREGFDILGFGRFKVDMHKNDLLLLRCLRDLGQHYAEPEFHPLKVGYGYDISILEEGSLKPSGISFDVELHPRFYGLRFQVRAPLEYPIQPRAFWRQGRKVQNFQ